MKKLTSLLLAVLMLFSVVAMSSCGTEKGFDFQNENLDAYVTLYNYLANKLQVDVGLLEETVTEEEVLEAIDEALVAAGAYYKKIDTAGTVCEMGDTVGIQYKGVLVSKLQAAGYAEDGTGLTDEQIKGLEAFSGGSTSSTTNLQLGSNAYIDGFEEGLAGKTVGSKNIPLALTFPESYDNADLKGQSVVFFVTIDYKLQNVDPRDLEIEDYIYVTYKAEIDEKDALYTKEAEDKGLLTEEAVSVLLQLDKDTQFHHGLILAFNELAADGRFGEEFTFSEDQVVTVTLNGDSTADDDDDATEGDDAITEGDATTEGDDATEGDATTEGDAAAQADEPTDSTAGDTTEGDTTEGDTTTTPSITKEDRTVTINYTVTVHNLCNVRYFTNADAEAGTELKYDDFCTKLNISKTDYPTYADYKAEMAEQMQLTRDIQIRTDLYKGAFTALVEKSKADLSSEKMQEVVTAYFNEVKGNIDYMEIQVQTDDTLYYNYYIYTLYYGSISVRNYVLASYGYSEKDLDITNKSSKLMTDAEEYVTNRLVFWQFVKAEGIELTEEEYQAGYEEYKTLYQYDKADHEGDGHAEGDFLGHIGATEEQLREALLWDKAAKTLAEKYCDIHKVPVKED